ncbi:hypothetical protein MMC12_006095 [Toensbergia leucococca]|nr:hypothetical protein [Toensbergia leucococca]
MTPFFLPLLLFLAISTLSLAHPSSSHYSDPIKRQSSPQPQPSFAFPQLYALQKKFYDNFIYPADQTQAKSINSSLLAEDLLGRIDITRTFEGRELNTEYLFGLFANLAATPDTISLIGVPTSYEIVHFAANQNIASASTILTFNFTAFGITAPVEIDSWITWNAQGQISQYDATFRWFQWGLDYLIEASMPILKVNSITQAVGLITESLAKSICATEQKYCNGTNQQYTNADTCYTYLTKEVRFGQAYELGRNTLLCRSVHQNMVPFRPSVHCPHIGPTGGGYCTDDTTYPGTVTNSYFTNTPFVPYGYQSGNAVEAAQKL